MAGMRLSGGQRFRNAAECGGPRAMVTLGWSVLCGGCVRTDPAGSILPEGLMPVHSLGTTRAGTPRELGSAVRLLTSLRAATRARPMIQTYHGVHAYDHKGSYQQALRTLIIVGKVHYPQEKLQIYHGCQRGSGNSRIITRGQSRRTASTPASQCPPRASLVLRMFR